MPAPFPILAIDGPSGVGKTTLLPVIAQRLADLGVAVEPSSNVDGAPIGPFIRGLLEHNEAPYTLALATAGARAWLCERAGGVPLLCDRFVLSTLVYQEFAGVPRDYVWAVNEPFAARAVHVVLRIGAAELARRRAGRPPRRDDWFKRHLPLDEELARFDAAARFLEARRQRVLTIDAHGAPPEVAEAVAQAAAPLLAPNSG